MRNVVVGLGVLISFAVNGCGGQRPPDRSGETATAVSALADPNDRSHTGRANYQRERAERFRAIARKEREHAQAFGRWTPRRDQAGKVNVNVELKARAEARAASADQTAAEIQALADFHTAEAAMAVGR